MKVTIDKTAEGNFYLFKGGELMFGFGDQSEVSELVPTPYDLLAGAVGGCMLRAVEVYCRKHGLDSEDAAVDVTFQKEGGRLVDFVVDLQVPKVDLWRDNHYKKLVRQAGLCSVKKTLLEFSAEDIEVNIVGKPVDLGECLECGGTLKYYADVCYTCRGGA